MQKVSFLELCHSFDGQVKIPYSTGCIWSYCQSIDYIRKQYQLHHWIYELDENLNINETAEKLSESDCLGVSYWVWNTRVTDEICKKVKQYNPNCYIIYGGLSAHEGLLWEEHIDYVITNEGEKKFASLLMGEPTNKVDRVDVTEMPSPYLDGLFDSLPDRKWEALIEPIRGCPYSCTFCEIGDDYYKKIYQNQKVFEEIDWISDHKVEYLHIVDNNYGMLPWHDKLTDYIIDKSQTGYPNALNISWAKVKKPHLYKMAKKLDAAGLSKGITIALQSLNEPTLKAIKRTNGNVLETINTLKKIDVNAHVELIMGLPEETVDTFKDGVFKLLDDYQYQNYIDIYPLVALPNTPFGKEEYCETWKVTKKPLAPVFTHHDHPKEELMKDKNELAYSMSFEDYRELLLWRWFITSIHFLGWTRYIANKIPLTNREFYDKLYEYIDDQHTMLGKEKWIVRKLLGKFLNGEELWGRKMNGMYWEYEEVTAAEIWLNKIKFYNDIKEFCSNQFHLDVSELCDANLNMMKKPTDDIYKWVKENFWWGRRKDAFYVS